VATGHAAVRCHYWNCYGRQPQFALKQKGFPLSTPCVARNYCKSGLSQVRAELQAALINFAMVLGTDNTVGATPLTRLFGSVGHAVYDVTRG
jgi:hypothetical protein